MPLISQNAFMEKIKAKFLEFSIPSTWALELSEKTFSTNDDLLINSARKPIHKILRVAYEQEAGRGQMGKKWYMSPGLSLCFSVGWCFKKQVEITGLSLSVGVLLAETLNQLGPTCKLKLKWPNDLLGKKGKIGGILTEVFQRKEYCQAVIGVGLNLFRFQDSRIIPNGLDFLENYFSSPPLSADNLLAILLPPLEDQLVKFEKNGMCSLQNSFNRLHCYHGQIVKIRQNDNFLFGRVHGIDTLGRIQIKNGQRIDTFSTGSIFSLDGESTCIF